MQNPPAAVTPLLYPFSLFMDGMVRARNALYEVGFIRQHRLPCPVISIGNLTMGGEGKTPLVLYVAALMRDFRVASALLSRGYGRVHPERTHILAPGNQLPSPWKNIGDEPALIRRNAPELWAGISRNRYLAARTILKHRSRVVFILDDGFQHRTLYRDLDLLIIDSSRNPARNRLFPLGSLREPARSLRRADAIVLNIGPADSEDGPTERFIRKLHPRASIFHCRQEIEATIPLTDWQTASTRDTSQPFVSSAYLAAAIGNPSRFERDVAARGIKVAGSRFYRDHRQIATRDWYDCADAARAAAADAILTTEKDAIKIVHPPDFPILVARQATRMIEAQEFKSLVLNSIGASLEAH